MTLIMPRIRRTLHRTGGRGKVSAHFSRGTTRMTASLSRHPVAADGAANPLVVEVTRGDMVESRHRAAVAILDRTGKVIEAWGNIERPVYGRSATKPIQALALIESGAAERYGLDDVEI